MNFFANLLHFAIIVQTHFCFEDISILLDGVKKKNKLGD